MIPLYCRLYSQSAPDVEGENREMLYFVMESYIARWKVEETIGFIKQNYRLDDIRPLSYTRLQNMMALVRAAAFFATAYIGQRLKLETLFPPSCESQSGYSVHPTSGIMPSPMVSNAFWNATIKASHNQNHPGPPKNN